MSTRSNYLLSKTPLNSLITVALAPSENSSDTSPSSSSSKKLPTPRQRTAYRSRARGLSILIPPPTQDLQKVKLVITYQSTKQTLSSNPFSYTYRQASPTSAEHPPPSYYHIRDDMENIRLDQIDGRIRYPGLIFVCVGLVTFGFTMLILLLIIPDQMIPIWKHHLHLTS
ncbi:hypothetical protein L486_01451 [Kwoniella mangroviensis CBS 10435]|uniref:Uncharacterized protein n=1 Tax=Kwoniella mangroviensis CBS 10435 TaxID=1331196 RepID=A0A1B9J1Y1_9TREE|nr:hypothetical protein L486_01451 [Kwoniella mangroviensis CBS 10435]OCF77808.1 hypothetical protein I204_01809 [Kwoniella mangroviensis CBS 8886]